MNKKTLNDTDTVDDRVSFRDIRETMKLLPKTLRLVAASDKRNFFMISLLSLLVGFSPILTLFGSQHLLNMLVTGTFQAVVWAFGIYIVLHLYSDVINSIKSFYEQKFETILRFKINYSVMEKCSKLTLAHLEDAAVYDKLQRVQSEVAYRPFQIFQAIISMITAFITLISSIIILLNWKPWVLLILIVIPVLLSTYFFRIGQREYNVEWNRTSERRKSWYLTYLLTKDVTFKEVKLYGISRYVLSKFENINKKFIKQDIALFKRRTVFTVLFDFIEQICTNVVLFIIIYSAYLGEILIGNVVGFIKALSLIQSNSKLIINTIYTLYQSNLYMSQLFDFLALEEAGESVDTLETPAAADNTISRIETIKISDLTFAYPSFAHPVLNNINLEFRRGERIAIVGTNGSGKSTLVKLLIKMYQIDDDMIQFNNKSINSYRTEQLQSCITVLFQDFVKYELTLRENVGFGQIDRMHEEEAISEALFKGKVDFENDLDTQLGLWFDEGKQLSGGQWQKVAIARSFFRDASLYILDEPSSALDPMAEKQIIDMFLQMTKDKIGIFISHRLSTAMLADRIVVMHKGEVIGIGEHQELLKSVSLYREMYELEQSKISGYRKEEFVDA
ncbi:ABC transporter ATP-binding protein [Paenibacillus bouchesdurhonensis]|uniref:ABC transporter ATP-binding protein n=1 Tax=Paenibacillus bouchesdurhonensis TaxID=1870990 RepID=UPI000DA6099D|nr:ABC transporter ATP-binding protein [Paenibacillus bouchesdurhonensis]